MIIAGIDYSMTSPSICIYDTDTELKFENLKLFNFNTVKKREGIFGEHQNVHIALQPKKYPDQETRFRNISEWVKEIILGAKVEEVVLEGYALGSRTGLVFQIAENTSLLKQCLNLNRIPFETPAPTSIKKNFSGSGRADKNMMVDCFHNEFPGISFHDILGVSEYGKPIDDIVDAYAIMKMHRLMKDK